MVRLLAVLAAAALLAAPTGAGEPSEAQQLRMLLSAEQLRDLRRELEGLRSSIRWPKGHQDKFLLACEKTKARKPSINRRTCECYLEVMMDRYPTFGEYSKDLIDTGAKLDKETSAVIGGCLAAFGT